MNLIAINRLLKLKWTLFSLPFAIAGGCLPISLGFIAPSWWVWIWGILGVVALRTAGLAFNELIDRKIDELNPRTQGRVLPTGQMKPITVAGLAYFCLGLFLMCCEKINSTLFVFALIPATMVIAYAYMKRITALCHFFLGAIYVLIPLMTWVAVTGEFSWAPLALGIGQGACIAGSDILYAIHDYDFDRHYGIYSLPSKLGISFSRWIARILHAVTILSLLMLGMMAHLHIVYFIGLGIMTFIFVFQHIKGRDNFSVFNLTVAFVISFAILGSIFLS